MADSPTPLTALCSICHSAPPKYTCPRDKVRTCSLACSQSHKRRAACTGLRDPSAYIPKSTLQTSHGIDRDYNFLTGLERNIDSAEKLTTERGVSLDGKGKPVFEKRWHDNGVLGRYLRENGVVVHRAPVGMARQKANQTRFIQKSKRIVWSVEWIVEGEKRVAEVDESRTLGEAYRELVLEKERENKKRKRTQEDAGAKAQKQKAQPEKPDAEGIKQYVEGATAEPEAVVKTEGAMTNDSSIAPSTDETKAEDASHQQQQPPPLKDSATQETTHFYLHKPHTSSTNTVLIPLPQTTTLTHALHQKHVLEFPTIYVFSTTPSKPSQPHSSPIEAIPQETSSSSTKTILPPGFITLTQYTQERSAEDEELTNLMQSLPETQRKVALEGGIFGKGEERKREEHVDEEQILEVLRRDADALKR